MGLFSKKALKSFSIKSYASFNEDGAEYEDGERVSEASMVFRKELTQRFMGFYDEVVLLKGGNAAFNDTWKDTAGKEGLGGTVAAAGIILAFLAAFNAVTAVASAGVTTGITIAGIGVGLGYNKYRDHKKAKEYHRAYEHLRRDEIEDEIRLISKSIAKMYHMQLKKCTLKDAAKLARACFVAVGYSLRKNDDFTFESLLEPVSLQAALVGASKHFPKTKLEMNIDDAHKYNTRSLIEHCAVYCKETNTLYGSQVSKPAKYGFISLNTKDELDEFFEVMGEYKVGRRPHRKPVEYKRLSKGDVKALMHSSLFKPYKNQDGFGFGNNHFSVPADPKTRKTI